MRELILGKQADSDFFDVIHFLQVPGAGTFHVLKDPSKKLDRLFAYATTCPSGMSG